MTKFEIAKRKIKRAVKGMFRNKETPLCDMCEYSGCLKCRIAKFTRCAHLFKADCYVWKGEENEISEN